MVLIFKFFLALIGFSIVTLLISYLLNSLELEVLSSVIGSLAIFGWFCAHFIIILQAIYLVVRVIGKDLQGYFNAASSTQRELLFKQNKQAGLKRTYLIQRQHLHYLHESKRLKLLKAYDKKHRLNLDGRSMGFLYD